MKLSSKNFIKAVKWIYENIPEVDRHREYLKLFSNQGLRFSVMVTESDLNEWQDNYTDKKFEPRINLIERLPNVLILEFDEIKNNDGTIDTTAKKPSEFLEEAEKEVKKKGFSYFRSTHKGKSDYLWLEFSSPISEEEAKRFLARICPKGARIDLNFSSPIKVFPVLFAPHRKYPNIETPLYFYEGKKINFKSLKIPAQKIITEVETTQSGYNYETFSNTEKPKEIKLDGEILEKLKSPSLIEDIKNEISKEHLEDDNLKMSVHLTHVSGLLKNPKRRQSFKISGKTAEGKDNLQLASLKHMPDGSYLFITSATQSVLEDDIKDIPILAISELNLFQESGANKSLLEVIKQRTEGGTTAIKKDLRTKNTTLRLERGEQGTVTFGTTEAEDDEELGTRLMHGTIKATPSRIKSVNKNTFETFSDEKKIISQLTQKDSWIKKAYNYFWKKEPQYEIVLPYAKFLSEELEGETIFDNSDARSQRDVKRLLSLTCAMTWIYQEQRDKKEINGNWFLISEPIDLINTLKYSNEFFNQTYSGFDARITNVLKFIESFSEWVDKIEIQKEAEIKHRGTINKYLWILESQGFIERSKGANLNEMYKERSKERSESVQPNEHLDIKLYKGNHIYYKSVQKAFNKRLISVQLNKLKDFLEERSVQKSVQINNKQEDKNKNKKNSFVSEVLNSNKDNIKNKKDDSGGKNERLKMNAFEDFSELDGVLNEA